MTKQNKTIPIIKIVLFGILFAVLTAALVLGIVFGSTSINLFSLNFNLYDTTGYSAMTSNTETLSSDSIRNITVDWVSGQINIEKSDDDSISISESYKNGGEVSNDDGLRYKIDGDELIIRYKKSQWYFGFGMQKSKALTLSIPEKEYNKLKIDTTSAELNISDAQAGEISVDSVSGKQTFTNITANSFDIDNVSGNLEFIGCKSDSLDCDGVSGRINYSGSITDRIDIDTVSGDISINTDTTPNEIESDSTSADFTLWLPYNASFTATADSVSGSFNSDFATTLKGGKYICGSGQSSFNFDSTSGSVQIHSVR
ncbi:MAG: DUF4097 family beta strand repeat-containing protein [Acutalibacteraceae bacterium]